MIKLQIERGVNLEQDQGSEFVKRRLREAREARGWQLSDLHDRTGLLRTYLWILEGQECQSLSKETVALLANALELPEGYFFVEDDKTARKVLSGELKPKARARINVEFCLPLPRLSCGKRE